MKQLKQKVINLGIERGYLPTSNNDLALYKFNTQFLRLQEEVGEASKELRLKNFDNFKMEVGDTLVLQTNCNYIVSEYIDIPHTVRFMDMYSDIIENLVLNGMVEFSIDKRLYFRQECLQLAYDKILARGGMLIGEDWFKPSDKEYQEAKLKELEHLFIEFLTDGPGTTGYVGRLKNLYFDLKNLDDSKLGDNSIERIVFLETKVHTMLKAI